MTNTTKDNETPQTADAHIWANEWIKAFKENPDIASESTMVTWFANAIMAGYMAGYDKGMKQLDVD